MGYDTTAYIKKEIAYLRRSMWGKEDMLKLYKALGIEEKFQPISGHGDENFAYYEIQEAIKELKNEEAENDMIEFLEKILSSVEKDEWITISFS